MGGGHTLLRQFLKPDKYFEDHADWYAYRKDQNKRMPTRICLANPQVQQAAAQNVIDYLKQQYPNWQYRPKIVSVSAEDNNRAYWTATTSTPSPTCRTSAAT